MVMEWHRNDSAHLVIGIDPSFTGVRYIKRTLDHKAPGVRIRGTLGETLWAAKSDLNRQAAASGGHAVWRTGGD